MEISQLSFVLLAVYSLCFGAILGVVYDVLRVTRVILGAERKSIPSNERGHLAKILLNMYVALGDITFVSACGMLSVLVAYAYNSGKARAIIYVCLAVGFLVYYNTVGRLVMVLAEAIASVIRNIAAYLIKGIRSLVSKITKRIKIKKKGAKNNAKQSGKTKKAYIRKNSNCGRCNRSQSSSGSCADKLCVKNR